MNERVSGARVSAIVFEKRNKGMPNLLSFKRMGVYLRIVASFISPKVCSCTV
jgi:hypothetical protein